MTFELELDYDGKPFTVIATVEKGSPAVGPTYNPKTANLIDAGCPAEPGEIDYQTVWFKSVESIIRLLYPPRVMSPLRPNDYADFVNEEARKLNDYIIDKIYDYLED